MHNGMANTLLQTAFFLQPKKAKKVRNLYFTGQLTVWSRVPPALICKLVSDLINKQFLHNMKHYLTMFPLVQ
jgi:phytoene desaturase